jgi:flagellar basal-body rod protein FlgB
LAFDGVDTARLLHSAMRVAVTNHTVIANNIANADTPGFNPTKLDFEATLKGVLEGRRSVSLRKTHHKHLEGRPRMDARFDRKVVQSKNDFNKVELEHEMDQLNRNSGKYDLYGALLTKRFTQAREMLQRLR